MHYNSFIISYCDPISKSLIIINVSDNYDLDGLCLSGNFFMASIGDIAV